MSWTSSTSPRSREVGVRASDRWRAMVEAEHAQSERIRTEAPPDDHWQPFAKSFMADPHRSDDPLLNRLLRDIESQDSVIDVGAGGGRLALPLALRCRHVTAVEPSSSMTSILLQQSAHFGSDNISLVQARWEEAVLDSEDKVLCAHVVYTVRDIAAFLKKLEVHARRLVMVVLFEAPPQSGIYPLWERVHREERLALPALPQLREVLGELGIDARVEMLPPQAMGRFDSFHQAADQLALRLFLPPGSPKSRLLEQILRDTLVETDGVMRLRDAKPLAPALVSWRPSP